MFDEDLIKQDYDKYVSYCEKHLAEVNKTPFKHFIENFGERLFLCPASTADRFHLSRPGGLLTHSIGVLNSLSHISNKKLAESTVEALVTTALLHDIGKLGNIEESYYIEKFDGRYNYFINEKLTALTVSQRSLKLLNDYKFTLTESEYAAIAHAYFFIEAKTDYQNVFNLPSLAKHLAIAKLLSIDKEKNEANA